LGEKERAPKRSSIPFAAPRVRESQHHYLSPGWTPAGTSTRLPGENAQNKGDSRRGITPSFPGKEKGLAGERAAIGCAVLGAQSGDKKEKLGQECPKKFRDGG